MITANINIGLNIGDGSRKLTVERIAEVLRAEGVIDNQTVFSTVVDSHSEPTYVSVVAFADDTNWTAICRELEQEAIALYSAVSKIGRLVGPKAEAWGPFDPSMFFTSSGKPLSELV